MIRDKYVGINKIFHRGDGNIIDIEVTGLQNDDTVKKALVQVRSMQKYLAISSAETKLLINTLHAGPVRLSAVPAAVHFIDSLGCQAIAIVRDTGMMRPTISVILKHSKYSRRVCEFDDVVTAQLWLANFKQAQTTA